MRHDYLRYLAAIFCGVVLCVQPSTTDAGELAEQQPAPRKILIDTDPGGDDVFALLWLQSLAKQGLVEIVAVTTVGGNVGGAATFANAGRTLALGGYDKVEVGRSAGSRRGADAAHIHGTDGMGGLSRGLPPPRHRFDEAPFSDDVIIEKLAAEPGEITLIAVGPLTNLAAAENKSPGILAKAKEVVVMGGVFRNEGNITPKAEFNIWHDPQAAATVFASRDDLVVLPLDVTEQVTFTEEYARQLRRHAPGSPLAKFVDGLYQAMRKTSLGYRQTGGVRGFHVHDATTLAYLFYPETLLLRRAHVHVETEGKWTRGQTVFDDRHVAKRKANAWVALQVDATNLLAIMTEDLKVLIGAE